MDESEKEEREFWRSLLPFAKTVIAWVDSLPARYADEFSEALRRADKRYLDDYFRKHLRCKRTPAAEHALWRILSRSDTWRKVTGLDLDKYLGRAVADESQRIQRKWEHEGLRTKRKLALEATWESERRKDLTPAPRPDPERVRRCREVVRLLREQGTDRDRRLLHFVLDLGLSPAGAMRKDGAVESAWESLQRKAHRWEQRILQHHMAGKRSSTA